MAVATSTEIEIQDRVYLLLKQPSTSKNYDLETVVKPKMNSVQRDILKGVYSSVLDNGKTEYQCKRFNFLKTMKPYNFIPNSALTKKVELLDTEIFFNTAGYKSEGDIILNENIIHYNGILADRVINCTGIQIEIPSGNIVRPLYPVPDDVLRAFELFLFNYQLGQLPYQNDYEAPNKQSYWRLLQNDTLLDVVYRPGGVIENMNFWLEYHHDFEDMDAPDSLCAIPGKFGVDVLAPIVAGELLYYFGQDRAIGILTSAYRSLKDAYTIFSQQIAMLRPKIDRKKPGAQAGGPRGSGNYYFGGWNNGGC